LPCRTFGRKLRMSIAVPIRRPTMLPSSSTRPLPICSIQPLPVDDIPSLCELRPGLDESHGLADVIRLPLILRRLREACRQLPRHSTLCPNQGDTPGRHRPKEWSPTRPPSPKLLHSQSSVYCTHPSPAPAGG